MSISAQWFWFAVAATFAGATLPAHADLAIANQPTKNVSCTGGSCVATAPHAEMNAADLRHLLSVQPAVSLDAGPAKNIVVDTALRWTSGNAFSLTATGALSVNQPITVASNAAVTINSASMVFAPKASVAFWDSTSALTINGQAYVLIGDIHTLSDVVQSGFYALANDCDGTNVPYGSVQSISGVFDGLGHTISNLRMIPMHGMFYQNFGIIRNLNLVHAMLGGDASDNGFLAGRNWGTIDHVSVTGTATNAFQTGGLVGSNNGTITNSNARVKMVGDGAIGGLVAYNYGTISASYAESDVQHIVHMPTEGYWNGDGGLVGINASPGKIENSYSLTRVHGMDANSTYGGLIGWSAGLSLITGSYAAGKIEKHGRSGGHPGGVTGYSSSLCIYGNVTASSCAAKPTFSNTYWDLDDGVSNPAHGAANVPNYNGITGLTDAQLKSGLPAGFDPKVWAQSPGINNGYPYLRSNPPQ